jgi:hypothetical protein
MQDLNCDPLIEALRYRAKKHDVDNQLVSPTHGHNTHAFTNELASAVVPYFWECPKQLLFSRQVAHLTGRVKNKQALLTNMTMTAIIAALAYTQLRMREFYIAELSLSLIDKLFLEQPVEHEFSHVR